MRFRPLRLRCSICLAFFLSTLTLIAIYAALACYGKHSALDRLRSDVLHDILVMTVGDLDVGHHGMIRPASSTRIYGDDPRTPPVPDALHDLPPGISHIRPQFGPAADVWREHYRGHDYVIVREKLCSTKTNELTTLLFWVSGGVLVFMMFVAYFLSGRIVRPVRRLADELTAAGKALHYKPLSVPVSNDEIGRLASVCDSSLKRLHKALERERTFTGDVSHELNSPLAVTETSLELLAMTELTPAQCRHVERALSSVEQMGELLTIFLAFARDVADNDLEATDSVARMTERMKEIWEPKAREKGLDLQFVTRGECLGNYSPVLLGTVYSNLLKNAVLYAKSGRILVTETPTGFEVEDEAGGIAPDIKARLFDRFGEGTGSVSLNREDGHGIGLNLVKRVADRCGWRVHCEDVLREGRVIGTCFVVTLKEHASTLDIRETKHAAQVENVRTPESRNTDEETVRP